MTQNQSSLSARKTWNTIKVLLNLYILLFILLCHQAQQYVTRPVKSSPHPHTFYASLFHCPFLHIKSACYININLLATDFFFQIVAHPVFKM